MNQLSSTVDIVIITAVLQGFMLAAFCFVKRKHKSHRYLSFFLAALSVQLFLSSQPGLLVLHKLHFTVPVLDSIPFLISPFLYFYVYYSFYRSYEPKTPPWFHLIPAALNSLFLISMHFYLGSSGFEQAIILVLEGNPPAFMIATLFLKIFSGLFYTFLISRMILGFGAELKEWSKDKKKRKWFLWLITSFSATWLAILVLGVLSSVLEGTPFRIFLFSLIQAFFFIWLIYMITGFALHYPALFENRKVRDKIRAKLNLSESRIQELLDNLNRLMEDEDAFTDPDLTLGSLAAEMNVHENILSFIINEKSSGNFSRFVNSYRIDRFISLVKNMDPQVDTYLTLAYTAGFNSKSSFKRIFKMEKGVTPTEFFKKNR